MTMEKQRTFIYLPGAGGGIPDLNRLKTRPEDHFEPIQYPGWKRYVAPDFTSEGLIDELADQIADKVKTGPIRLVGLSSGGHFGYASALRLQERGREVAGLCAIDSFMYQSDAPNPDWKKRAVAEALMLLRERRFAELSEFVRSRFWRALMRLSEGRLENIMRKLPRRKSTAQTMDPLLEKEMNLRLLLRVTTPWVASLDENPVELEIPSVLIRTNSSADDDAWRRRCPNIEVLETAGGHHTLFDEPYIHSLRDAFTAGTRGWR